MKSAIEMIKTRISCRTYEAQPVDPETVRALAGFLETNTAVPFGSRLRFRLLDLSGMDGRELKGLGTYGVIRGASLYIAGAVARGPMAMEDFGYAMEKNVLKATEMGLGTCWLGGTFNRSGFADSMEADDDELIPAVTPVGYASSRRSVTDRLFRFTAASHKRKPWPEIFFRDGFDAPLSPQEAGRYETALEMVRLAPSASNKQPWRIVSEGETGVYHFYLKRTPAYDRLFKGIKLQNIDMGIAICHFEMAALDTGLKGAWVTQAPGIAANEMEYIATWMPQKGPLL